MGESGEVALENRYIGDYLVLEELGKGGFGKIYIVRDTVTNCTYAMKVSVDSKKGGEEIEKEAMIISTLSSSPKCIVPKLQFYQAKGSGLTPILVMELLGPSLAVVQKNIEGWFFSSGSATVLAYHMFMCVWGCHEKRILHRDVKPENFVIRPSHDNPIAIIDFGISKDLKTADTCEKPGKFMGTFLYASKMASDISCKQLSWSDDLMGWFYSVIALVMRLPWDDDATDVAIREKREMKLEDLATKHAEDRLPPQFQKIGKILDNLEQGKLNGEYDEIKDLLEEALETVAKDWSGFEWEGMPSQDLARISRINLRPSRQPQQLEMDHYRENRVVDDSSDGNRRAGMDVRGRDGDKNVRKELKNGEEDISCCAVS